MHVYMALDPETQRVTMQTEEFGDGSFPRGLRGKSWPRLEGEVDETDWQAMLEGRMDPVDQDVFHLEAWVRAGGEL